MIRRRTFCSICGRAALVAFSVTGPKAFSAPGEDQKKELIINDPDYLGRIRAPMFLPILPDNPLFPIAQQNRLQIREISSTLADSTNTISNVYPVQWLPNAQDTRPDGICWLMPPGATGPRRFILETAAKSNATVLKVQRDQSSGQFDLSENQHKILRYNYATIQPGQFLDKISPGNRIYAIARSNYIHPLYGPFGEELTKDWSIDHPHHRGIYWAWPEVDWKNQRGDLHALQKVFARPTGRYRDINGPVFTQIEAENVWQWDNVHPIVQEKAIIRAWKSTPMGRAVDLIFRFAAIDQPVLLARRDTRAYGGLNLRFSRIENQQISKHIELPTEADSTFRNSQRAWAEISGVFAGGSLPSGVIIFQHARNPDYPGNWVDYPDLNWLQPTFPASGARYVLNPDKPLTLKFRLWIHPGPAITDKDATDLWLAMHVNNSPL